MAIAILPPEPQKICSKCNLARPLAEFDCDRSHRDGHASQCRSCRGNRKHAKHANANLDHDIWLAAAIRLIEIHPVLFRKLEYTERVQRGLIDPVADARRIQ